MKKLIITSCTAMIVTLASFAQPISDRAVIPVAVTLNQVLRLHVTNGGNIEFVFNTIDQYKNGIATTAFYQTTFVVASSTDWELYFGAEDPNLFSTDAPGLTMALDNIGYQLVNNGAYSIGDVTLDVNNVVQGTAANNVTVEYQGLEQYPGAVNSPLITAGTAGPVNDFNGGDIADNSFQINWQCGIVPASAGLNPTNGTTILSQKITPDRYVTNVLLEINSLP